MLVLVRKQGEEIVIPICDTSVTILGIEGKKVRVGVTAPDNVNIRRGELPPKPRAAEITREEIKAITLIDSTASIRVLIADSDRYLTESYRDRLSPDGFEVFTAKSGAECVEKLRKCSPDVLVLEPSIPWGGGDGVLAMMHEEPDVPLVPVIVITYGRDRGVLYRLAPYPIDDFQTKPLSAHRLAERIQAVFRSCSGAAASAESGAR